MRPALPARSPREDGAVRLCLESDCENPVHVKGRCVNCYGKHLYDQQRDDPEFKAKNRDRAREWRNRPGNAERKRATDKAYREANKEKASAAYKAWAATPEGKASTSKAKSAYKEREADKERVCQLSGFRAPRPLKYSGRALGIGRLVDKCHIKPKARCGGRDAKDKANIINLDVRLHRMFDAGMLLFTPVGVPVFDYRVPASVRSEFDGMRIDGWTPENNRYMEYRRGVALGLGFREFA